jgi:hypothetical protein
MESSHYETQSPQAARVIWVASEIPVEPEANVQPALKASFAPLKPIRQWLNSIEIRDRDTAHILCSVIPAQCPFERTIKLLGRTILYIPPLCKLNPFYDEVVGLRFRSLCYLADECSEDISPYC